MTSSTKLHPAEEQPDGTFPKEPAELFRAYSAIVGRWAHRLTGPSLDVEDVVHEVFLRAFAQLPKFRGECEYATWLFRITQTVVRDHRRRERLGSRARICLEEVDELAAPGESPLAAIQRLREVELLYRALDGLKERYRVPLILFSIEGLSGEEVAKFLDIDVNTVWVRIHRAKKQLVERLKELAEDLDV